MKKYTLSKNYKERISAGNKAKTDIEHILTDLGYANAGLHQATYQNPVLGFFHTLISAIKSSFTLSTGDVLLVQYPFKKYYGLICRMAHWKKAKVITLIHDLGSFRRKKLTIAEELKRLKSSDVLIVHNEKMKEWLLRQGYDKPMISLEIFDYLSSSVPAVANETKRIYKVVYAGALSYKKNGFLYKIDPVIQHWKLSLYGKGITENLTSHKVYWDYKGFIPSDRLIETVDGNFGLVWDGDATTTCSGAFGEYLKYNNPHKTSLYIRCHLPVIIWEKAALAPFVSQNRIGLCINSLDELDSKLFSLSSEAYAEMKQNVMKISRRLSSGYYTIKAIQEAEKLV